MKQLMTFGLAAALVPALAGHALAEWKPAGPITLSIGFKAGGGTDTQARLIGEELAAKKGWKFIFQERHRQRRLQPCTRHEGCEERWSVDRHGRDVDVRLQPADQQEVGLHRG